MATTVEDKSCSRDIPTRKVVLSDPSQLPVDYSSTPGGTWFSTTPGGTRIVYDRTKLLAMRDSPLSRTPPTNLPKIPGVTSPLESGSKKRESIQEEPSVAKEVEKSAQDDNQFEMEI
eukprot:scpid79196/ scgid11768/ Eukaryotic translation initiation factor 4E-binding protein 2